jgi:riboflavin synthase
MFTGIVEELGEVDRLDWHGDGGVLAVRCAAVADGSDPGDSIAVNGVCLTAVRTGAGGFTADVMKETFERSTLGGLAPGQIVNLERAAMMSTRLGGHLVQGHVDGVGAVLTRTPGDRWEDVVITLPSELARYVVEKGSIAVDGVSLTVVSVSDGAGGDPATVTVSLIPATLERTTLGLRAVGDLVNVEVDVIAKYVERLTTGVRR